jgi:predicted phosphodiesterase
MKLTLVSDLHLEFCGITLPGDPESTLLLAGDIVPAACMQTQRTDRDNSRIRDRARIFFDDVSKKYKGVFYIMGNHEHYHGIIEDDFNTITEFLKDYPITCLNGTSVPLTANTRLYGATLWTNFRDKDPIAMNAARMGMNDFCGMIRHKKDKHGMTPKFTADDSYLQHQNDLRYLRDEMAVWPSNEFLVMTHHCPSYESIAPKYIGDNLNFAFASDLSNVILDNPRIKTWVHGHTHTTFDYKIGDCRVICNPRGYTRYEHTPPENTEFNPTFSFEVS